jgi:hypothetical protein
VKALAAVVMVAAGLVPDVAIHPGAVVAGGGTRAVGWTAAAEAAAAKSDGVLNVAYRDGFLTVYCANTALDQVFERVEATTGIRVVLENQSVRKCRPTAIRRRPLDWALERLLTDHGFSYVLVLAPNDDIVTVRVFDTGERIQRAPPSPVRRMPGRLWRWPGIRAKPGVRW